MPANIKTPLRIALLCGLLCVADVPTAAAADAAAGRFITGADALTSSGLMANVLTALNIVAWIGFNLLEKLLDPDFIFNTLQTGGGEGKSSIADALNSIWVLSRNIVNIAFAVALLIGAMFTVVKADISLVKENMGRFVLAVVLVNFSWLFPLMIIDLNNIMTSVVYGLPEQVELGECKMPSGKDGDTKPCEIVTNVAFFLKKSADAGADEGTCPDEPKTVSKAESCSPKYDCSLWPVCYQAVPWSKDKVNASSRVLQGLVFNYAHLGDMARLPTTPGDVTGDNVDEWIAFVVRMMLVLLIHIALVFPLMALVLAFLMRIPVMWVTAAFMPFFFIGWVLETAKVPGGEQTKSILSEFMKAAFLPTITAIPLTVGFIMMNALSITAWKGLADQTKNQMEITAGVATLFDILWLAMALGIMWVGTFKALEKGGMAGQFGGYFKTLGESIGKFAGSLALSVPAIPGTGGSINFLQAGQMLARPNQTFNRIIGDGSRKGIGERLRDPVGAGAASKPNHSDGDIKKYNDDAAKYKEPVQKQLNATIKEEDLKQLVELMNRTYGTDKKINNDNVLEHLKELQSKSILTMDAPTQERIRQLVEATKAKAAGGAAAGGAAGAAPGPSK